MGGSVRSIRQAAVAASGEMAFQLAHHEALDGLHRQRSQKQMT